MKATLKFKLPRDGKAFLAAAKADDMAQVLWEIVYNLRKKAEWHYEAFEDAAYNELRPLDGVGFIMEEVSRLLNDEGIDIDQLIE